MTIVAFSMNGDPRGKGRHNVDTRGASPRAYTDAKTRKYEASVKRVALAVMAGRPPLQGALSLSLRFRLAVAKSHSKAKRAAMLAGEIAPYWTKPDFDNAAKAVCDAMNKVVYLDDVQVCRAFITKIYAEQPGVDVRVEAYAPQPAGEPA